MPKVTTNDGVELHYHLDDFRDPWAPETEDAIFMHHGYARSMKWWIQWVPGLSRKYKVIRNELPDGCQVQRAMKSSLVRGPVSKEAHRHPVPSFHLGRQGRSRRYGQTSPHDAVGPQHTHAEVGDMHRAAFAVAVTVAAPEQLRHHQLDIRTLGDGMPVTPMGAGDPVLPAQGGAHPHGHRLLPNVGVDYPRDVPLMELLNGLPVEFTDCDHSTVHL